MEHARGEPVGWQSRSVERHGYVADVEPVSQSSRLQRGTGLHEKRDGRLSHVATAISVTQTAAQQHAAIQLLENANRHDGIAHFAWPVFLVQTSRARD